MEAAIVNDVLVELARREHELTEFLGVAARGRKEARDRQELLVELADDAHAGDDQVDSAEAEFRRRDRELRALETRLADRRDRLVGVGDRRQHRALSEEIASLVQRIDQLEEEAIAALDTVDARRDEAAGAHRDQDELARRDLAVHADLEARVRQAEVAQAEIQGEIDRLVAMLPPDVVAPRGPPAAPRRPRRRLGRGRSLHRLFRPAAAPGGHRRRPGPPADPLLFLHPLRGAQALALSPR